MTIVTYSYVRVVIEPYSRPWSDLPTDLLRLVYAKLVGTLQRVCFAAVCTSWRDAVIVSRRAGAPPVIPWHFSSFDRRARLYCPEDDQALVFRVPSKAEVGRCLGGYDGGWIAALTYKHVKLVIFNIFSGIEMPLPYYEQRKFVPLIRRDAPCTIRKIVFSKAPTSSECILAALTYCSRKVALCRVGRRQDDRWITTQEEESRFDDIVFCNGELYGLTAHMELFRFDITNKDGATSVVVTRFLSVQHAPLASRHPRPYDLDKTKEGNHLFVLGGKLGMATTWWYKFMPMLFDTFELTYDNQGQALKWAEMTNLGEHALFLGERCSAAFRVPAGGRGQVEQNCIYTDNTLYKEYGRVYDRQKNERRIKVVHASEYGMWLIPPSV